MDINEDIWDSYFSYEQIDSGKYESLILHIDGDYIRIYSETNNEHLITYVKISDNLEEQLISLFKDKVCDLSKVTWPRHADGSSDYEGAESPIGSDIMTVKENLRLRSGESTTTQVLAVMQAGSKVKILNIGDDTWIDGMHGFWMKVEVQEGAKDRDGKPIREGTVGWCFGGYLE